MLTKEKLKEIAATNEDGPDLPRYAAHAAILELAQNWRAALNDGLPVSAMVKDVDDTIDVLNEFKRLVAAEA